MSKNFTKKTMKKSTAYILIAVAVVVVGLVGFLSNGFTNGDVNSWIRERNPDNLLDYTMPVEDYVIGDGTTVNIAEDGTIKVTGEIAEDAETWSYELGDVLLPAGTYTLTCSDKCNKNNYIIVGTYTDASGATKEWYSDMTATKTVTLTAQTTVSFELRIYKDGPVNVVARPVLSAGTKAVDFYVNKTIGE